ncbi:MAG: AAA family ATPase [Thermomicrobiales bacterium]
MNADARSSAQLFVPGRRSESEMLGGHLTDLRDGRGSTVLISGEAGIGKTTIVEALSIAAAEAGVVVLAGISYDMEVPPPYGLWQELFRNARHHGDLLTPPAGMIDQAKLETTSGARELWDLTARAILDIADDQPVLLILEDLHWADQSSIELLRYLARMVANAPVFVVITYRDVDLTPAYPLYHLLPHLVREVRPTRLPLRPLSSDDIGAIVQERYPSLDCESAERLTFYLNDYAEGNPLFIEELLGLLEETNVLRQENGDWRLEELPSFVVPPLIRQIIEGRLDQLSPAARKALELASVIGIEVPLDVWQSVSSMHEDADLDALEEVLRSQALQETSRVEIVRFRHALVRDAIYSSTNPLQRRKWHALIGGILARRPDVDPGTVAHHFLQASDPRAADWLIESAQRAGRAFAFQAAIDGYERALGILDGDPDGLSDRVFVLCALAEAHRFTNTSRALGYIRQAVDLLDQPDDPGAAVLARWVQARIRGFDDENALGDLIAAATAFEQLPESEQQRITNSPLGYVVSRATLAQDLANYGMFGAALEQAERFIEDHPRPASRARYIEFGNAHFGIGIACAALGEPDRARAAFETSRQYFRESGNFQMISNCCYWELSSVLKVYYPDRPDERHRLQLEEVQSNLNSEFVETETGERQDSTSETLILDGEWGRCWRSANLRLGIPASRVPSARKLAEIEWLRGNTARAWDHIRTVLPAGPEEPPGRRFFLHRLELQRIAAELAMDSGDLDLARRWIDAFDRWIEWSGRSIGKAETLLLRARLHEQQDEPEMAAGHAQEAIQAAETPPQPLVRLHGLRLLGEIDLEAGNVDGARRHLEEALAIAEVCGAPYEVARTSVSLAGALIDEASERERASLLLDTARSTAQGLGARPLLERIDAVEARSQAQASSADELPLGLTARQLEVLRLLARGMTDAEIADELFISPRTVHGHLNTIYGKLEVD